MLENFSKSNSTIIPFVGVGCGVRSATPLYPFIILYLLLFLFLLLCRALSVDVDRFVSLGVYALFISLPCFLHIGEERRKGNFFQRLQRVGDFTGFQILPTSKKDIDRSFRRELLYKLPPFNFQFEPRWMFLFNFRHLLTTLLELLARSCAAACPRRHRECGAPHGGVDPALSNKPTARPGNSPDSTRDYLR